MHCSELYQHLADLHIIENNLCACGQSEKTEHFFFTFPLYQDARHDMQRSFIDIQVDLNLQTISQGHSTENENIVQIVDTFLTRSKRFFNIENTFAVWIVVLSCARFICNSKWSLPVQPQSRHHSNIIMSSIFFQPRGTCITFCIVPIGK